jgi:hypothetical protein
MTVEFIEKPRIKKAPANDTIVARKKRVAAMIYSPPLMSSTLSPG